MAYEAGISALSGAALFCWLRWFQGASVLDQWLAQNRGDLYGTLAQILGSLLGFAIAVVAIVIAAWGDDALQLLRESPSSTQVWDVMKSCTRWLGVATILSLTALVFDRDQAIKPSLLSITLFTVLLASFRLIRTIWILESVMAILAKRSRDRTA